MTFWTILRTLIIGPLELIFEVIFQLVYRVIPDPGICIIALSLAMNFLVLPLYRRADAMQKAEQDRENELAPGIDHIKKTFSGNERMMILQTYYRQNHYSPLYSLKSAVSLLLEIPFFLAAYHFLSTLPSLAGASLGPISDLSVPDGLLKIGVLSINVLPILMTLINFASAAIYLKGYPMKTKIRTYLIAVVFLVLLYGSPSGLVFYWTLNNVFSLVKNLIMYVIVPRVKERRGKKKAAKAAAAEATAEVASDVAVEVAAAETVATETVDLKAAKRATNKAIRAEKREARKARRLEKRAAKPAPAPDWRLFVISCLFLTVLIGAYIPSVYLAASPQEFVNVKFWFNPIWYNISAFLLAAGLFLLWFGVFYWLASDKGKVIFERVMLILALCGIVNYMFFGTNLGMLSSSLLYDGGVSFDTMERIYNGIVTLGIIALVLIAAPRFPKIFKTVLMVGAAALIVMGSLNTVKTRASLKGLEITDDEEEVDPLAELHFTRSGKNVVVLFLDRAIGEYIPCFLKEKPEFAEIFDGFTYYSNTISYGGHTNFGAPPLMGGYEYTPVEMNKRDTVKLKDKHNEAIRMLPVLFSEHGYGATVCDPPYANYKWIPDLSIFDLYPDIDSYITKGSFVTEEFQEERTQNNLRNFFMFSLMKTMQLELQPEIYDSGNYLKAGLEDGSAAQFGSGRSKAIGLDRDFMDSYEVLENLTKITRIEDDGKNQYLFFYNDATHTPVLVKEPEYVPASEVDNTEYDAAHEDRFVVNGKELDFSSRKQMSHYESNMASLLKIGEWFDYLRKEGVYDNTRIIIVSDHGYYVGHDEDRIFERSYRDVDTTGYYPLLMVKDFDAHGFKTSDEFMTNADVPSLAVEGLIENAKNPFTGKEITMDEKTAHDQFIVTSQDYKTRTSDTTFVETPWAIIHGDINNRDNWKFIDEEIILKEHEIPGNPEEKEVKQ